MLRRRTMDSADAFVCGEPVVKPLSPNSSIQASNAVAGNIVYYSASDGGLMIYDNASSDHGTPIGVVVVPGSHDVYGDGSCGVMSIVPMNYSTPEAGGTSEQGIYWGGYGTDLSTLPNLNVVGYDTDKTSNNVTATTSYAYLPSTNTNGNFTILSGDGVAKYYNTTNVCPSPYLADGSRNPAYYMTDSPSSALNALADFDGWNDTCQIMSNVTVDWSGETITNSQNTGNYPAACCCKRFHTNGTEAGDWYLGACGEMGYMIARFQEINNVISDLKTANGVGVQLSSLGGHFWSSSEYSSYYARYVYASSGRVYDDSKGGNGYVRAWLRVG